MENAFVVRRSVENDHHQVAELEYPSKSDRVAFFGKSSIGSLIETCSLALTATEPEKPDHVLGFGTFNDQPVFSGSDDESLVKVPNLRQFLQLRYELPPESRWIFLTYFAQRFATNSSTRNAILRQFLTTLFTSMPLIDVVLVVLPASFDAESENAGVFKKGCFVDAVKKAQFTPPVPAPAPAPADQPFATLFENLHVYQALKQDFVTPIHVRKARVEDHDDLEPILKQQNEQLVNAFGKYFLAELIQNQNDHNMCLVAQAHHHHYQRQQLVDASSPNNGNNHHHKPQQQQTRAVGLLAISDEVNVLDLQENFELEAYNQLAKQDADMASAGKITPPMIIICGPPAGGKGTQCEILVEQFGVVHLSTGDMLRASIAAGNPLGLQAKVFMDAGELVPDDLIVDVILDRLQKEDCSSKGWLLDGFPRTKTQADAMIMRGILPDTVILLEVPDDEVVKRISGRRVDPETGKTYHLVFNPPPEDVKSRVIQRSDDTEETIRNRLEKYHANVDSVIQSFATTAKIIKADGTNPKHIIAQNVCETIHTLKTSQRFKTYVRRKQLAPPRLIITGPPAGGKGTQCEYIVEEFDVVHLSTGDMLRASINAGAPLGLQAKKYMEAGELVPDELIIDVILERLAKPDCTTKGWLLDGFPRTAAQAQAMINKGIQVDEVMVLDVPDEEVIKRISGRRVDPVTNKTYHVEFNPPPLDVKDRVIQRSDDNEHTIKNRLLKYHENCDLVLHAFANCSKIVRSDGLQPKKSILRDFTEPIYEKMVAFEHEQQTNVNGTTLASKALAAEARANCFCVTLFCMEERYDVRAKELLVNAFATFPQKEYCLLTLQSTCPEPTLLNFFTLVPPKPKCTFTHVLYLVHRDAVAFFSPNSEGAPVLQAVNLSVDRYVMHSQDALAPLLMGLDGYTKNCIKREIEDASEDDDVDLDDNPKHAVFLFKANANVVGLATLMRQPDYTNSFRHHFCMDQFILTTYHRAKDQALVKSFVLNPIFQNCQQFFLQEVMRMFKKTCLFYQVPTNSKLKTLLSNSASAMLHEFILAPPRRSIELSGEEMNKYGDDAGKKHHTSEYDLFSLFFLTKKLLHEPKINCNQRIVVVGASDTGLTVLQRLLAVPYLRFTNLCLISPRGLEFAARHESFLEEHTKSEPHLDFARKSLYSHSEVEQYSLKTHVRVIESKVVQISRQAQAVVLKEGYCIPYDYLVLTTGLQDGTCTSLGRLSSHVITPTETQYVPTPIPDHMIVLNDLHDAKHLDELLTKRGAVGTDKIVVYGSNLFAFEVVNALVSKRSIAGNSIVHVRPSRNELAMLLDDDFVRGQIDKAYQSDSVQVVQSMKISELLLDDAKTRVHGIKLVASPEEGSMADAEESEIKCDLLICCQQNDADQDIFRAMNESGLVYDGRLVVNGAYRTTDPHIFAGGSGCRFSRRFVNVKLQEHYSSKENGELLASSLLRVVDPIVAASPLPTMTASAPPSRPTSGNPANANINVSSSMASPATGSTSAIAPPEMRMPVVRTGLLLGNQLFLQISLPSVLNTLLLKNYSTNKPSTTGTGFRYTNLLFDDLGVLNRLVYFGNSQESEVQINLMCLVGMHESYLNSAIASYEQELVTDWMTFFHQKWASALYHDRFHDFCNHLNGFLKKDDSMKQIVEEIKRAYEETGEVKSVATLLQEKIGRGGENLVPSTKRMIESQLLDFLSSNREILTMYLLPKAPAPPRKK